MWNLHGVAISVGKLEMTSPEMWNCHGMVQSVVNSTLEALSVGKVKMTLLEMWSSHGTALVAGLAVQGVARQGRVSEVGASPIRQGCRRVALGCAYKCSYFVERLCL